uniref:Uncharacterized protein n=1 Tax=Rhizophora mucronata TaxID=61149 RepID=A0A2P2R3V3_RHIMU
MVTCMEVDHEFQFHTFPNTKSFNSQLSHTKYINIYLVPLLITVG